MKKVLLLLAAASFVFAGTAEAGKKGFAELDENKDGKLSKEECLPSKAWTKTFAKKDKNNDGFLSEEETKQKKKK